MKPVYVIPNDECQARIARLCDLMVPILRELRLELLAFDDGTGLIEVRDVDRNNPDYPAVAFFTGMDSNGPFRVMRNGAVDRGICLADVSPNDPENYETMFGNALGD